jgi:predicted nucleotidyltransferase
MAFNYETLNEGIIRAARSYASEAKKVLPIRRVVLFGSYAKGMATKQSDVDICFFLDSFGDKQRVDILQELIRLAYSFDEYFEPTVFETSDLHNDNPFVKEVLKTGVDIL